MGVKDTTAGGRAGGGWLDLADLECFPFDIPELIFTFFAALDGAWVLTRLEDLFALVAALVEVIREL